VGIRKYKQKGSVEVVALIIIVAVISGLVAWRIADTMKTQQDTQEAVNNTQTIVPPQNNNVAVEAYGLSFKTPPGHSDITVQTTTKDDAEVVQLVSATLKNAEYLCEGENKGIFGNLVIASESTELIEEVPTIKVGDKTYGFERTFNPECFKDDISNIFSYAVPKTIVENLEALPVIEEQDS